MKKLMFMAMVLVSVAAMAPAALMLDVEVDGVDYAGQALTAGTVVTVNVVQDMANQAGSGGIITADIIGTPGSISGLAGEAVGNGWDWMIAGTQAFIGNQAYYEVVAKAGKGTPGMGSLVGLSAVPMAPYSVPYVSTMSFSFAVSETQNLALGGLWDGVANDDAELITVVPEPMTMALLGLGGLFLRRRRA